MREPKDERLTIPLGRSWLDAIDRAATALDTTRSEITRQALREHLSSRGFAPSPAAPEQRL
jgi:metal-responsive CopG/Arc/MetJ family transcriptional regulator